jgi:hypothetical protein
MLSGMQCGAILLVRERRRGWGKAAVPKVKPAKGARASPRRSAQAVRHARNNPTLPEGWSARLKQQAHSLARAVELLDQAATMAREPHSYAISRAQSLRASALIAMVASAELLVAAGWFEADDAMGAGSVERE